MELDGYCAELGIAFEHNGIQHYSKVRLFNNNLEERQENDVIKKELCIAYGIKLIVIPALFYKLKYNDLKNFLIQEFDILNIVLPNDINNINFDISKIYCMDNDESYRINYLQRMKNIAISRNGVCLSEEYFNVKSKLEWKCNLCNHKWESIPNSILRGSWCPKCSKNNIRLTIQEMKDIANSKNGKCLSDIYINSNTSYLWECDLKHIWSARAYNVKRGSWCPWCSKSKSNKTKVA